MNRKLRLITIPILLSVIAACIAVIYGRIQKRSLWESVMDKNEKLNFVETIIVINGDPNGDLTSSTDLFKTDLFPRLYENADLYYDDALLFISDSKYSEDQKVIASLAMSNLQWDRFVVFINKLLNLCEEKIISPSLFARMLFPGYEFNSALADHFEDERVKNLLIKIVHSSVVEQNSKKYAEDCLLGKAKQEVNELRLDGQIR